MNYAEYEFALSAPIASLTPAQKALRTYLMRAIDPNYNPPSPRPPVTIMRTSQGVTRSEYDARVARKAPSRRLSFQSSRAILMLMPLRNEYAPFAYDQATRAILASPLRASKANCVDVTLTPRSFDAPTIEAPPVRHIKVNTDRVARVNAFDATPIAPRYVRVIAPHVDATPIVDAYLKDHAVTRVASIARNAKEGAAKGRASRESRMSAELESFIAARRAMLIK